MRNVMRAITSQLKNTATWESKTSIRSGRLTQPLQGYEPYTFEIIQPMCNHYHERQNDFALLEINPGSYVIGNWELLYYGETDFDDGNPKTQAVQWLIQDITYRGGIK